MKFDFSGQQIIVTGAAQGIGRAIAKAFATLGGTVWICDIDSDMLAISQHECGPNVKAHTVDVADPHQVQQFVTEVGEVAVLVNCAGGVRGQEGHPLESITPQQWHALFQVNVDSTFWFAQAVAPTMKRAGYGRMINISSGAGLGVSLTGIQAYASAKAAQIGLTRQLAHELGEFGITVNSVAPGFVRSNPSSEQQWQKFGATRQQEILSQIATRRLGTPEDIAHAVLFFASPYAKWISGQILSVDGGK
ncbi:SDR family oxidoreductase [Scandinavium sp. H11S7]|uniref:SDR family oxidoreductase n=1 Tax=Scandinavium hiltneri TaxID=2926519 RepID=A0ABT2E2S7_9ENTR|nr:SDR family oxidoreductase [Scandinavium hiltneri]MCS2162140.1 SDR family oxidoreductase [Scandinavium hiltneri]